MKTVFFTLFLAWIGLSSYAQLDTLDADDYIEIGDKWMYYIFTPDEAEINSLIGIEGEDVEWDFTDVMETSQVDSIEAEILDIISIETELSDLEPLDDEMISEKIEQFGADPDIFVQREVYFDVTNEDTDTTYAVLLLMGDELQRIAEIERYDGYLYSDTLSEDGETEIDYGQMGVDEESSDTFFGIYEEEIAPGDSEFVYYEGETVEIVDGYGNMIIPDEEDEFQAFEIPCVRTVSTDLYSAIYLPSVEVRDSLFAYMETEDEDFYPSTAEYFDALDNLMTYTWYGFFINEDEEFEFGEIASFQAFEDFEAMSYLPEKKNGNASKGPSSKGLKINPKAKSSNTVQVYKNSVKSEKLMIYPSIADEYINIALKQNLGTNCEFKIYSINGKLVKSVSIANNSGAYNQSISLEGLNAGTYIGCLSANGKASYVNKFVKK